MLVSGRFGKGGKDTGAGKGARGCYAAAPVPSIPQGDDAEWNQILREASKMGQNIGERVEALPVGERTGRPDYGAVIAAMREQLRG